MGRVIAEKQGSSLQKSYVYGNQLDEALVMYLPEPASTPHDANGSIALIGFCNAWLTTNSQYNYDANGIVDFKDYAVFASNWTGKLYSINTILPETEYYYLHDAQGSVVGLIGGTYGREEDREYYNYDAYGTPDGTSLVGNPYMFQGKRFDLETGTYHFWYRDYPPPLGRWMQADPIGYVDGMNLYEFSNSNSVNYGDLLGLMTESEFFNRFISNWMNGRGRMFTDGADVVQKQLHVIDPVQNLLISLATTYCDNAAKNNGFDSGQVDTGAAVVADNSWYMQASLNGPHSFTIKGTYDATWKCAKKPGSKCKVNFNLEYKWIDKGDLNLSNWADRIAWVVRLFVLTYHTGHHYQDFPIEIKWPGSNRLEKEWPRTVFDIKTGWPFEH